VTRQENNCDQLSQKRVHYLPRPLRGLGGTPKGVSKHAPMNLNLL